MADVSPNFTGQSNAPMRESQLRQTGIRTSVPMRDPPRSAEHISGAATSPSGYLVYPHDYPKYFMHFGVYEYNRPNFRDVGSLDPWKGGTNQIFLPLSEALQDNLQANWETKPIPWMIGGLSEMLQGLKQNPLDALTKAATDAKDFAGAAAREATQGQFSGTEAGATITRGLASFDAAFGSRLGDTAGALTGFAPNQFMTVLYIGPEYKQHTFSWNFSPRDEEESETLRRIINVFKKAMSPTVRFTFVWGYPCIFRIMFRPNNEQLYKFKPMCLKDFKVNWAPAGRASFYRGIGAPEGVNVTATFLEMEYWHQEAMREQPLRDTELTVNRDGKNNPV